MNNEQLLRLAILKNPLEDEPRRQLADWLMENDRHDEANLLLAGLGEDVCPGSVKPHRIALRHSRVGWGRWEWYHSKWDSKEGQADWWGIPSGLSDGAGKLLPVGIRRKLSRYDVRRGFVCRVRAESPANFIRLAGRLFKLHPVESAEIITRWPFRISDEYMWLLEVPNHVTVHALPLPIFTLLRGKDRGPCRVYDSPIAAQDDLSQALVRFGRIEAGLESA